MGEKIRTLKEHFEASLGAAEEAGGVFGATRAEISAEAAVQALNSQLIEIGIMRGEVTEKKFFQKTAEIKRKKKILREKSPLNTFHEKQRKHEEQRELEGLKNG